MSATAVNCFIGCATTVLDVDQRKMTREEATQFGGRVLAELARTFTLRVVEEHQGDIQVERRPQLRETEFRLELYVFNKAQLDAYYDERRKAETEVIS